ncbi:hypothetical protein F442_03253 [Phytophthora nicotianae P10297]|uniref:BZIP domain-containing protein n=1 Tax=Phytophthora nicotianae P10297 TaxID=1317064 RepID=W2ZZE7_PHYNI|nr:hypothetical protein F442_03253 [Phytophthora nicotianae P10297]
MASHYETPGLRSHRFEQARARLSDGLVGLVVPRAQGSGCDSRSAATQNTSEETAPRSLSLAEEWHLTLHGSINRHSMLPASDPFAESMSPSTEQEKVKYKQKCMKSEIRREQCRANQARYRNKQRSLQMNLESSVEELHQELCRLKRRRQDIVLAEKTDQNPWTIVAEVFHILQNKFLQNIFTSDAAMGKVSGIDELIDRWRRYSQYFGDAHLYLQRVESLTPGVMRATARLHVTITELIVRFAFPHLLEMEPVSKYDINPPLRERLVGQLVDCSFSIDFHFDEDNGRVARLEPRIDVIPELLRVLGNLSDVDEVCYSPKSPDAWGILNR